MWGVSLIASIMLLIAPAPLPYGYYQFLRWVVCGIAIFVSYKGYNLGKTSVLWIFIPIAILFNPLLPISLSREVWLPIDIICAVLFGISIFILRQSK